MTTIRIDVPGKPIAQPRVRRAQWGGMFDPGTADGWKAMIALMAKGFVPNEPISGPLCVDCYFRFERPKGHFRSGKNSHLLKADAPPYWKLDKPDRDNLDKAVLDALSNVGMWRDDCQACSGSIEKRWCAPGETPGATIVITTLE